MPTRRRLLLACLAVSAPLGGCIEDSTGTPTPPDEATPSPTPSATPTPSVDASYTAAVDQDPDGSPTLTVEPSQPDAYDSDEPITLEVTLTNDGDDVVTIQDQRPALFWGATAGRFGLYPVEAFDDFDVDESTAMWYATDEFSIPPGFQPEELEPGETITDEHYLLHRSDEDRLETYPTELVFETTYGIERPDDDGTPEQVVVDAALTLLLEG